MRKGKTKAKNEGEKRKKEKGQRKKKKGQGKKERGKRKKKKKHHTPSIRDHPTRFGRFYVVASSFAEYDVNDMQEMGLVCVGAFLVFFLFLALSFGELELVSSHIVSLFAMVFPTSRLCGNQSFTGNCCPTESITSLYFETRIDGVIPVEKKYILSHIISLYPLNIRRALSFLRNEAP